MQYVRSTLGSVSKTWNSINPATLSGAIDVIVVQHEDGTLACSPFHVRFGKYSILRPSDKKVEFYVNNIRQDYSMKLGEGGEAFFVFETSANVPEALQTSPLVSPAASPGTRPTTPGSDSASASGIPHLDLEAGPIKSATSSPGARIDPTKSLPILSPEKRAQLGLSDDTYLSASLPDASTRPVLPADQWRTDSSPAAPSSDVADLLGPPITLKSSMSMPSHSPAISESGSPLLQGDDLRPLRRTNSPPLLPRHEAVTRAKALSQKLRSSNIQSTVNDEGDLMLDMTGYKSSEEETVRAEVVARQILSEEIEGNYDIGSLLGSDDKGNLWIYSSEEAKEAAARKTTAFGSMAPAMTSTDALSDPGYHSDDAQSYKGFELRDRRESDSAVGLSTPPDSPTEQAAREPSRNYAKTLRLTSDQLKSLELKPGANPISFTVNRATCQAYMYLWKHDVPIVVSDVDGTITKSDVLGHVLNTLGRDWTHLGVAKLYTDIVANGYNIFYLTSRSVGQADMTRTYLTGINQEGYKLPRGPVIMSPDRTIAALRREVYLRKPEVFKMACLRDIMQLFGSRKSPFCAGFGNRLTDALSYRSVNIPSTRIFTINSNAEVSLDLLSLNKYKTGYQSMREIVDHYFPPVGMLVHEGGEEFTDFNYWRERPQDIEDFDMTDSEDDEPRLLDGSDDEDLDNEDEDESRLEEDEGALSEDEEPETPLETPLRESLDSQLTDSIERDVDTDEEEIESHAERIDALDLTSHARPTGHY